MELRNLIQQYSRRGSVGYLLLFLLLLILMTLSTVVALPITSKPIEGNAQRLAWDEWLRLPQEQKTLEKEKKVTAKSIFTLPFRQCPPGHKLYNERCIPLVNLDPTELLTQEILGLVNGGLSGGGGGSGISPGIDHYDYDEDDESAIIYDESLAALPEKLDNIETLAMEQLPPSDDAPLKFNIFEKKYPTDYGEMESLLPPPPPSPELSEEIITRNLEFMKGNNVTNATNATTGKQINGTTTTTTTLPTITTKFNNNNITQINDLLASSTNLASSSTQQTEKTIKKGNNMPPFGFGDIEAILLSAGLNHESPLLKNNGRNNFSDGDGVGVQVVTSNINANAYADDPDSDTDAHADAIATLLPTDLTQLLKDDALLLPTYSNSRVTPLLEVYEKDGEGKATGTGTGDDTATDRAAHEHHDDDNNDWLSTTILPQNGMHIGEAGGRHSVEHFEGATSIAEAAQPQTKDEFTRSVNKESQITAPTSTTESQLTSSSSSSPLSLSLPLPWNDPASETTLIASDQDMMMTTPLPGDEDDKKYKKPLTKKQQPQMHPDHENNLQLEQANHHHHHQQQQQQQQLHGKVELKKSKVEPVVIGITSSISLASPVHLSRDSSSPSSSSTSLSSSSITSTTTQSTKTSSTPTLSVDAATFAKDDDRFYYHHLNSFKHDQRHHNHDDIATHVGSRKGVKLETTTTTTTTNGKELQAHDHIMLNSIGGSNDVDDRHHQHPHQHQHHQHDENYNDSKDDDDVDDEDDVIKKEEVQENIHNNDEDDNKSDDDNEGSATSELNFEEELRIINELLNEKKQQHNLPQNLSKTSEKNITPSSLSSSSPSPLLTTLMSDYNVSTIEAISSIADDGSTTPTTIITLESSQATTDATTINPTTTTTTTTTTWSKFMPLLGANDTTTGATGATVETTRTSAAIKRATSKVKSLSINTNRSNRNSKIIRINNFIEMPRQFNLLTTPTANVSSSTTTTPRTMTTTTNAPTTTSTTESSSNYEPFWWLPIGWRLDRTVDKNGDDRSLLLRFFTDFHSPSSITTSATTTTTTIDSKSKKT